MQERYDEYMELGEYRIGLTGEAWDKLAEAFFKRHGWTKSHMAYDTERATKTLWVMTEYEPEVWEDTGISAKEADRLLTEGWDTAEHIAYEEWLAEQEEEE
jgi:hypothetical protein